MKEVALADIDAAPSAIDGCTEGIAQDARGEPAARLRAADGKLASSPTEHGDPAVVAEGQPASLRGAPAQIGQVSSGNGSSDQAKATIAGLLPQLADAAATLQSSLAELQWLQSPAAATDRPQLDQDQERLLPAEPEGAGIPVAPVDSDPRPAFPGGVEAIAEEPAPVHPAIPETGGAAVALSDGAIGRNTAVEAAAAQREEQLASSEAAQIGLATPETPVTDAQRDGAGAQSEIARLRAEIARLKDRVSRAEFEAGEHSRGEFALHGQIKSFRRAVISAERQVSRRAVDSSANPDDLAVIRDSLLRIARESGQHAAAAERLQAETAELRKAIACERTAAAERLQAIIAELRQALARQRAKIAERLQAETAELRQTVARQRAAAAERLQAETAELREAMTRAQQEAGERGAALSAAESEAAHLRTLLGERDAAVAVSDDQVRAAEARLAEALREIGTQHAQMSGLREAVAGAENALAQRDAALRAREHEAAQLRTLIGEREAAAAAAQAHAREIEASLAGRLAEISSQRVHLQRDLLAAGQVGRELLTTASLVDLIVPSKGDQGGRLRMMMLGFGRTSRARAIDQGDRARDAKQWQVAARHYREALARDPLDTPVWVQYGHALKESGHLAEAEAAYRRSLACDPGKAETHLQLGHVLKLQGRTKEAQAAYLRAVALDPAMPYPMQELAALGWPSMHLSQLGKLSVIPNISQLQSLRDAADAARDRHDWPNAAKLYAELIAADPAALEAAVQLGHAYKEMGELTNAADAYYGVLEATPLDDDLHLQIGHLEKLRGNLEAAFSHYKRAVEIHPDNADAQRECAALGDRASELHPGEEEASGNEQIEPGHGQADHHKADELRFLDTRAGEIYQQLVSALV